MQQQSLFDYNDLHRPLADRLRPTDISEYAGQQHLLGEGKVLRQIIEGDHLMSMIFWGPPGVGKTTLARIISEKTKSAFVSLSATSTGVKEIKEVMNQAETNRIYGERTILFIDEIHRFNKAQQDAFLPFVEKGSIILIGATTENPSFEVNSALLSRCKVFVLNSLTPDDLVQLLRQALASPKGFGGQDIVISDDMLAMIAGFAAGDARMALNTLEMVVLNGNKEGDTVTVTENVIEQCTSRKSLLYDKNGEEHYNIISALHKSMRNTDVNAALYWLARMLEAGENPLYVARRLVRFASEDIGIADSRALEIAVAAYQACHFNGMPECNVNLAHAVTYLTLSPKSNALDVAYNAAARDAINTLSEPVPLQIRNAPTRLMKDLGYGKDYQYAHHTEEKLTNMACMPEALQDRKYYRPTTQGKEARAKEKLEAVEKWKEENK